MGVLCAAHPSKLGLRAMPWNQPTWKRKKTVALSIPTFPVKPTPSLSLYLMVVGPP